MNTWIATLFTVLWCGALVLIITSVAYLVLQWCYERIQNKPMPIEYALLVGQPLALSRCPRCGEPIEATPDHPHEPFMRGQVQRIRRSPWAPWKTRPHCAVICYACKEIVDWEEPFKNEAAYDPAPRGVYRTAWDRAQPQQRPWANKFRLGYLSARNFFADAQPAGLLAAVCCGVADLVSDVCGAIADLVG
jgi:hypothetical protein